MKLYTRGGDAGQTSLASGERISKGDPRVEVVGILDEVAAWAGYVLAEAPPALDNQDVVLLRRVQTLCLTAGAWVAEAPLEVRQQMRDQVSQTDVDELERQIDQLTEQVPPLRSFILPGGTVTAAKLHLLRTAVRSLERGWVQLPESGKETAPWPVWRAYWNRLSDYCFALARSVNQQAAVEEPKWEPRS